MPLSLPAPRKSLHRRTISSEGFQREDGLWDIEAQLIDVKRYAFKNRDRGGEIHAGEPVHEMRLRMTIDLDFKIHGMEAVTEFAPYHICREATAGMQQLVGLRIGPGWMRKVKQRIGGSRGGCTHLLELLPVLATTAFQTISFALSERDAEGNLQPHPGIIDSCHALASDGPVVKRQWPERYTG